MDDVLRFRFPARLIAAAMVMAALAFPTMATAASTAATGRQLTLEERVRVQEAIERVYYSHQIGATKPFDEAVPRALLEKKVRTYLKQSAALEKFWRTPVTAEMLQAEIERMTRQTRMPERLRELLAALGDDPVLIQECLARATLADRLARNFYAFDSTFHAAGRREAEALREALVRGQLDPRQTHARRTEVEIVREESGGQDHIAPDGADGARRGGALPPGPGPLSLSPEEFARLRGRLPAVPGEIGPVDDSREAFVVQVMLKDEGAKLRVADYRIEKKTWDEWWGGVAPELDEAEIAVVARADIPAPQGFARDDREWPPGNPPEEGTGGNEPSAAATCAAEDTWATGLEDAAPEPRGSHAAVWTGSRMIVWGGYSNIGVNLNAGGRYDPATDSWTPTSTVNAPWARGNPTAVWTGSLMVVWGGSYYNTGGRYDPATDSWTPTSTVGAPSARYGHTAVWTGSRMVIWGGYHVDGEGTYYYNTGGRYDPATDSWTPTSTVGAPSARYGHTAVWTGSRMVVWSGEPVAYCEGGLCGHTGGRYDPATDSWTPTSTVGAPQGRTSHTATWTGGRMVVWGGRTWSGEWTNTGGRYDPVTNSWTPTSTVNAPSGRPHHTAVWTGSRMVVWGGGGSGSPFNTGGRYDPATNTWSPTSTTDAPSARSMHTAVWTGSQMIVWGGGDDANKCNTGGRYDPATDTWTPTKSGPSTRSNSTAVWTGTVMVVWGGVGVSSGEQYDPATNTWSPTSTTGAPSARSGHTAVWTGSRMVIWGGHSYLNTGGRYDPATDTWTPTSTLNAPSGRGNHTAVWTGSRMVVWGGGSSGSPFNTGGRYDPATDTWTPTSTTGAPTGGLGHTAVWTGREMLVWGGGEEACSCCSGQYFCDNEDCRDLVCSFEPYCCEIHWDEWCDTIAAGNCYCCSGWVHGTGARYDPVTDAWTPISNLDAPSPRHSHTAAWTGSRMVVWGGASGVDAFDTGGRYDPATDTWSSTSTSGGPSARASHTAVWTGSRMVVWGGADGASTFNAGGRYDPATDTWNSTSTAGAPDARAGHSAVWTGSEMIVAGGGLRTGGRYCACAGGAVSTWYPDADSDGFGVTSASVPSCSQPAGYVAVGDDCDDRLPGVYPGARETCNARDDDCDGAVDDDTDLPTSCGLGPCAATGVIACINGVLQPDTCTPGPSGPETCNGIDDDCDGVTDEVSETAGFANPADRDEFSWPAQVGATSYEVIRSTSPSFTSGCVSFMTSATAYSDTSLPTAGTGFFYLVRPLTPFVGSWGQDSSGAERVIVCP